MWDLMNEIIRIGVANGILGVTVWRFYQKKFIKQFIKQLSASNNETQFKEIGDVMVPWTISNGEKSIKILRYYHLFRIHEFNTLMNKFDCLIKGIMGGKDQNTNFIFYGIIPKT